MGTANTAAKKLVPIEILRAGRHTDHGGRAVTFSSRDLDELAASYDPRVHRAPVVVGHPKTDAPAYGWTEGLRRNGDVLEALVDLSEPFKDVIRAGHYQTRSASIYLPGSAGNPTPGRMHLKHIGFLGAQPPAIKGLAPVSLAEDATDGAIAIQFAEPDAVAQLMTGLRAWFEAKFGAADADAALPKTMLEALTGAPAEEPAPPAAPAFSEPGAPTPPAAPSKGALVKLGPRGGKVVDVRGEFALVQLEGEDAPRWVPTPELAAVDAPAPAPPPPTTPGTPQALAAQAAPGTSAPSAPVSLAEANLAKREAEIAAAERRVARDRHVAWLDGLVRSGRPLPAWRDDIVNLFEVLDASTSTVSFAEVGARSPSDVLRAMLSRIQPAVSFGEHGAGPGDSASDTASATALAKRASAIRDEHAARGVTISDREALAAAKKKGV